MNFIALRMLTGDRAKYLGLIFAIAFSTFLLENQTSIFSGILQRTGSQIADVTDAEIWVMDLRTGALSQKTRIDSVKSSPVWSPDGNQLIFAMEAGPQLYRMSAAGGTPQRINTNSRVVNEPSWSRANPNKIAYTYLEGARNRIGVVDLSSAGHLWH